MPYRFARAALIAALLVVSCRKQTGDELVIISPHSAEIRREFSLGFSRWYNEKTQRSVNLKWLDIGGTGESIEYIRSRNADSKQAGGVDIFFGGGNFPFIKLTEQNLLLPHAVADSIAGRIPAEINGVPLHGKDSLWYGAAISGFGILYNKEVARRNGLAIPARWEDLAQPECFGWVSSGDPRYSGSIHMMYEILLQAYGWERGWGVLARMGANTQTFSKGASTAAKSVSMGQAAFGLAIDFYAFIEIERYGRDRLGFVLPEGETVVSADGIGVLKNAPSPDVARMFVDYVLGEGQRLWVLKTGCLAGPVESALCRFPVDSTLYSLNPAQLSVTQNPYTLKSVLPYNAALGGKRWAILGDLIAALIITPHEELKECYRAALHKGVSEDEMNALFAVEISEDEALELAGKWGRRQFAMERIRLMNQWSRQARKRYESIHRNVK